MQDHDAEPLKSLAIRESNPVPPLTQSRPRGGDQTRRPASALPLGKEAAYKKAARAPATARRERPVLPAAPGKTDGAGVPVGLTEVGAEVPVG